MTVTRTNSVFAALFLIAGAAPASAEPVSPSQVCLDSRIRKAAAESVGTWAQQFPFAKALIGSDGRFGDVGPSRAAEKERGGIVCHASFNLVRVASSGRAYAVAIPDFAFRAIATGDGNYTIVPVNLPNTVSGETETLALIDRFTVDGRPYRETIADNLTRLQQRTRQ